MSSVIEKKLVWWRDVPVDVEIGLLTYLSENWKNEIYIISANDYEPSRKQCAWNIESFSNVHIMNGNLDSPENRRITDQLLAENNVNIFSGIKGGHRKYLEKLALEKNSGCIVVMESTSLYGSKIKVAAKKIAYPFVYGRYYRKYRSVIKGLFAMGKDAAKQYSSYGWKNIFDFMYLPKLEMQDPVEKMGRDMPREMKMLYIGRFDFATKGVHILMDAIDQLNCAKPWHLDLVGGYGAQKDEVVNWCSGQSQVDFLGSWEADSVVEKMRDYDFCIVPSICDGYNLTPLQTLYAGIGCITTDNAGSQELIRNSGAGVVIPSKDSTALKEAIGKAIENPNVVEEWKVKTREYVGKVSPSVVGNYFIQGIQYCYGEIEEKPECPW